MRLIGSLLPAVLVLSGSLSAESPAGAKHPTVFFEESFPTVASEPIARAALQQALQGAVFAGVAELRNAATLRDTSVLVLPYGSAFPVAAWPEIESYLHGGGNLLLLGGQPLRVPIEGGAGKPFTRETEQDTYSRSIGLLHTYAAPLPAGTSTHFAWRDGFDALPKVSLRPRQVFVEEGRLNGLGYLEGADGTRLAAPVIVMEHPRGGSMNGARVVALPFHPQAGFWESTDGVALVRTAAQYAMAGTTQLSLEAQRNALRPGERPELTLRLRQAVATPREGAARVDLLQDGQPYESTTVSLGDKDATAAVVFRKPLPAGVYTIRATWTPNEATKEGGPIGEYADNGFVVEELAALETGPGLGVQGDFLTLGGAPFLPVGTNYFSTDANGWDFSGPRNGATWERDFADMERHGVSFVRTGVWMPAGKFVEGLTGEANERFLRNLEAYLSAAHRHHIAVNFTCFAFTPRVQEPRRRSSDSSAEPVPPNPYLDRDAVSQEQEYVASVARRFHAVPWLSYDLINEPSFSNPRVIFHGNVPNGDAAELAAWHGWLQARYGRPEALAAAWRVTPEELGSFDSIPLPQPGDLTYDRYGNQREIRAFDYNLFAQDMFSTWVREMVATIRGTGSQQLINVGQDEGGVTNRLLNQFYATAGVSFTTNHTYWQDDALLWDSVAAKRPGMPNITGETGYQPAWNVDGSWRYDELTGTALEERKWALGFAAGSSGALQWDWDREVDFGMQRSDGSAKLWEGMMADLGSFAKAAAPYATGQTMPQVAIVLPQSLQLSVFNAQALAAQQMAVRVLFNDLRVEAYAVGEFQTETLGTPRLILLPSPFGLSAKAWSDIEARVRDGAVLLVSGPFSGDEHLNQTDRAAALGIPADLAPLLLRNDTLTLPGAREPLVYEGLKTTTLDRMDLPHGATWMEKTLGKGKVFLSALPLELNRNEAAVAAAYAVALKAADVQPTYTTEVRDPGVLICPTRLPHATLYVVTSETQTQVVMFKDVRSGARMTGTLEAGHAALLLVGEKGQLLASYRWNGTSSQ